MWTEADEHYFQMRRKVNEPVAWMPIQSKHTRIVEAKPDDEQNWIPLYLHPTKTLTDEEIWDFINAFCMDMGDCWDLNEKNAIPMIREILKKVQE
jgi:hypothetical protein